jgi:hypothetical protein
MKTLIIITTALATLGAVVGMFVYTGSFEGLK